MRHMKSSTQNVYANKAFGVSKGLVDLRRIQDSNRKVKVIINGVQYKFKHAEDDSNRLSGMGKVAHFFKGVNEFGYYYDTQKRAIVILLSSRKRRTTTNVKRIAISSHKSKVEMDIGERNFLRFFDLHQGEFSYKGKIIREGFDFEIHGKKATVLGKYIEVKQIGNKQRTINITKAGYNFAIRHKNSYYVYLIDTSLSKTRVYKIPLGKLNREPDYFGFKFSKKEIEKYEL